MNIGFLAAIFALQFVFYIVSEVNSKNVLLIYYLLSGLTGILLGGPYSRLAGTDFAEAG